MNFDTVKSKVLSLINKYTWYSALFVIIHQLCIAISVYASFEVIYEVNTVGFENTIFRFWCCIYNLHNSTFL